MVRRPPPPKGPVLEPQCPCCGAPISGALALDRVGWFVGPTLAEIVRTLRRAGGGPLPGEALAGAVYRAVDGGPQDGAGAARQAIQRHGHKLRLLGWEVATLPHQNGFALRKAERSGGPETPPSTPV